MTTLMRMMALACAVAGGCTVGPDYHAPDMKVKTSWPRDEVPFTATRPSLAAGEPLSGQWWKAFNDPHLDALIQRAMKSSYDVKIAAERVLESRAQNTVAAGRELPGVNAGGTYDYYRRAGPLAAVRKGDYQWFFLGFDSSWELDLFGGIRRGVESSMARYQFSLEASRGVRVTLAAEVARRYIELRASQRRLAIARENLGFQEHTLTITRQRLAAGVVTDLDVSRATALVAATRAAIPPLKSDEKRSIRSLGVLLGEDPDALAPELQVAAPIPTPPGRLAVGVPADLLRNRPDLRQAERQLAAATAQIGVATADLYPHLTLLGTLGAHDVKTSDLFTWSAARHFGIGPSVSWNIFDAGRTRARIDIEKAATAAALAQYQKTLIGAIAEAEDEMTGLNNERDRAQSLEESVDANRQSAAIASRLYLQGVTDFISVLDAERSLAASEDALVLSDEAIGVDAVSLCKALGLGWPASDRTGRP
jgi:outer membrane protein, multidrug efflux system